MSMNLTSYADKTSVTCVQITEVVEGAYGICWISEIYKDTLQIIRDSYN